MTLLKCLSLRASIIAVPEWKKPETLKPGFLFVIVSGLTSKSSHYCGKNKVCKEKIRFLVGAELWISSTENKSFDRENDLI